MTAGGVRRRWGPRAQRVTVTPLSQFIDDTGLLPQGERENEAANKIN